MDKLLNFRQTLNELKSYLATPVVTNRDRAGVIQAFEFAYEQTWKAVQKFASESRTEVGSPKSALIFALQNNWIKVFEEAKWLKLLKDKNLTVHTCRVPGIRPPLRPTYSAPWSKLSFG